MARNTPYPGIYPTASLERDAKNCRVPDSFIKRTVRFGLAKSLSIGINHLRFKRKLRALYRIELYKTIMSNFDRLDASNLTKWFLLRLSTSYLWNRRIYKIEKYFNRV